MVAGFLLVAVLLVELASAAFDYLGYSQIARHFWGLYCRLTNNKRSQELLQLRQSITQMRSDLRTISSVDEFARWAKLRRKLDSASASFEKLSGELSIERTAFELYVNLVMRVVVYGARIVMSLWNYGVAVFYVPENWFYPFLWALSLPGAPAGGVSVAVWSFACNRVFKRAVAVYERVYRPVAPVESEQQQQQMQATLLQSSLN